MNASAGPSPRSWKSELSYYEDLWQDLAVDDAEVTLRVSVPVVPASAQGQASHLATLALRRFAAGAWQLTLMLPAEHETSRGASFLANTRLPLEQLGELTQRAAESSSDNVQLTDPLVRHGVAPATQAAALRALALQAFAAANTQASALSAESQRAWRVERVECHCPRQFPLSNLTRSKHLADAAAARSDGALPTRHRLSLLAHVTLVSDGPEGA
jgi:hypothetical protein